MDSQRLHTHITRRNFLRGIGLLSASAGLAACTQSQQGQEQPADATTSTAATPLLAIIHTNDTHGHDVEVEATKDSDGNFSMAAVAQLRTDWEEKGYEVLLLDAGDATQGTPLVDQLAGESAITFMNACGYDAMTVGNHEFDRGDEQLSSYEKLAEFPLLSANIQLRDAGELRFTPHTIIELGSGTKVGIFGLTTPATISTAKPALVEKYLFLGGKELYDCAQAQVDELRKQGCDIVICLGHLGNEEQFEPSTSKDVLSNVRGIDLFIDGHDHELVEEEVDGTLLVETGCHMHNIGLVLIDEGLPTNESLPYGEYTGVDTAAQAVIDEVAQQVESELNVVLGHTSFLLDGTRDPGVRTQETNLGDFCCDAFLWSAAESSGITPDAALLNGGGIRSSIEEGDITLGLIKTLLPFSNQVCILTVTGAQLLEALEAGYQSLGVEAIGAFPQVAGIELTVDQGVPYEKGEPYPNSTYYAPARSGSRVTIATVGGRPWSAEESYVVAMNDFIAEGGDTYAAFVEASEAEAAIICDFDYEAFASYLTVACDHEVPDTYAGPQGRITVIG